MTAAENGRRAIEVEELIRASWPRAGTTLFDDRAASLTRRLRLAGDDRKARVFAALDVERQKYEPTAADMVRIGLGVDDAINRANRRAREFQQLCARLWRWKVSARDRYV